MMPFSSPGLRWRLTLLVLLAVIPALEDALRLARIASSDQERLTDGARQLLLTLAQLPTVRADDTSLCTAVFAGLVEQYPFYANLGAFGPDGDVFCRGVPLTGPVNAADRAWFQRTVQTRDFAIGDYQIGRITRIPALVHGHPILDASLASARAQ